MVATAQSGYPSSQTPQFRRVLNGAAKFLGSSSYNAFLTGNDLLQNLMNVLTRFRW